jgi:membrane-bound metal-dependent hydrolase YbcI (DUF457 family)
MPSPVGHGLAGLAIALAGDRTSDSATFKHALTRPLTLVCVALATLPDADLLIPGFHRRATHSIAATIAVTIVAIVVTGWVNRSRQSSVISRQSQMGLGIAWRVVLLCAAAHASHIVTDWLGADRSEPAGIQVLWPWSDRFFISGWDLFPQIERRDIFSINSMLINLNAFVWELLLTGSAVAIAWWLRGAGRAGMAGRTGKAGRAGKAG